jgi:HAD superfamily hydrolase (TIGR01509 family)
VEFDAVLFDVGNTLLSVPRDPHERAIATVSHLGTIPFKSYKVSLQRARQEWAQAGGAPGLQDLPETWIGHIERALDLIKFEGDRSLAARLIEESFLLEGWEVYPEASEVLEEVRSRGIPMGVVSNWPPTLEATLEAAGLRQYFDVIVVSGVVGYAKPHPEIFRLALSQLNVPPERALFVGDSIELDVEGPAAAGMSSILIDREQRLGEHHGKIESLYELLERLPSSAS